MVVTRLRFVAISSLALAAGARCNGAAEVDGRARDAATGDRQESGLVDAATDAPESGTLDAAAPRDPIREASAASSDASDARDPALIDDAAARCSNPDAGDAADAADATAEAACEPPCCEGCTSCGDLRACLTGDGCYRFCGCDGDSCLFQCHNRLNCQLIVNKYYCTPF